MCECWERINNKWYVYDDMNVSEISGNIISSNAYCLFYRKKN